MSGKTSIFYSALMLTGVNLLLRFVGTSFQVYTSSLLGPAGVGLLQLVLSVGNLATVAAIAGVRTATMYLTAGELGRGKAQNVTWVLSGAFLYSILCSGCLSGAMYLLAPRIAEDWIGDRQTVDALRLFAAFLPAVCLSSVMTGYFTAASRIGTLAAVEIAEQLCAMAVTLTALRFWAGEHPGRACMSVILGSSAGACVTLVCLVFLRLQEAVPSGKRLPVRNRLLQTALPLALADVLKSGITTAENLMVPRRLAQNQSIAEPLAAFGVVSGMVFPVLMFPACILFGLGELLIPELARCAASGSGERIRYLVRRSLKIALLYGVLFGGLLFLLAEPLCMGLYGRAEAGVQLRRYALLVPMLYCDAITDAMTKGLGQQSICVRYNILTSALDVVFLYLLLPAFGMDGYFASFFLTHLLNFLMSLRRLLKISGLKLPLQKPLLTGAATAFCVWAAGHLNQPAGRCLSYVILLCSALYLLQVIRREDIRWLRGLAAAKS